MSELPPEGIYLQATEWRGMGVVCHTEIPDLGFYGCIDKIGGNQLSIIGWHPVPVEEPNVDEPTRIADLPDGSLRSTGEKYGGGIVLGRLAREPVDLDFDREGLRADVIEVTVPVFDLLTAWRGFSPRLDAQDRCDGYNLIPLGKSGTEQGGAREIDLDLVPPYDRLLFRNPNSMVRRVGSISLI